jgi:hypothetical protein
VTGPAVTTVLVLLAGLAPAAGTGTAGMIWLRRLWLRYRAETATCDSRRNSPPGRVRLSRRKGGPLPSTGHNGSGSLPGISDEEDDR